MCVRAHARMWDSRSMKTSFLGCSAVCLRYKGVQYAEVNCTPKEGLAYLAISCVWMKAQPRQFKLFLFCLLLHFDPDTGLAKGGKPLS